MNPSASAVRVVLCTCPPAEASRLARALLEERLVACVNVVSGVRSLYWWKDAVSEDEESLLVIKTTVERYPELERRLPELHPYDCPELLSLGVEAGLETYISWVFDATRS